MPQLPVCSYAPAVASKALKLSPGVEAASNLCTPVWHACIQLCVTGFAKRGLSYTRILFCDFKDV